MILLIERLVNFIIICYYYASTEKLSLYLQYLFEMYVI